MAAHPSLGKATWSSPIGPSRRNIFLQCPSLLVDSNATEFNPSEEYENFLVKQREKTVARKEAKEAKKMADLAASAAAAAAAVRAKLYERLVTLCKAGEEFTNEYWSLFSTYYSMKE